MQSTDGSIVISGIKKDPDSSESGPFIYYCIPLLLQISSKDPQLPARKSLQPQPAHRSQRTRPGHECLSLSPA